MWLSINTMYAEYNYYHRLKLEKEKNQVLTLTQRVKDLAKGTPINTGKTLDEVQKQQRRRKIAMLRESVNTALQFCNSFGLTLVCGL